MRTVAIGLMSILLGNLLVLAAIGRPQEDNVPGAVNTRTSDKAQEPQASEDARREWALGCAAVLTERNHDSHTLLGGCPLTEVEKTEKRRLLSESWDINSREEFFKTLEWIDREGHRAVFEKTADLLSHLKQREYQMLLRMAETPAVRNKLQVARQNHKQLGSKSLYGWDYSRGICLCRWAYAVDLISAEEAWERIMPMALLLQEKFDSWDDLGRNYLIGRQFWSYQETRDNGWEYEDAVQRLLDMQSSPWNRYPWDMKLRDDDKQENGPKRKEPTDRKEGTGLIAAAR